MLTRTVSLAAGLLTGAATAIGQTYDAPPLKTQEEASTLIPWVIGAVFLVGCLVVAFKPSKRSNLR